MLLCEQLHLHCCCHVDFKFYWEAFGHGNVLVILHVITEDVKTLVNIKLVMVVSNILIIHAKGFGDEKASTCVQ